MTSIGRSRAADGRAPGLAEPGARLFPITIAGVLAPHRPFASAAYLAGRLREAGGRPVTIWISSSGGSVEEAHAMCAELAAYPGRVTCVSRRNADSAALLVYAAADTRIAGEDSTFSLHKTAAEKVPASRLTAAELRRVADELGALDVQVAAFIGARCGASPAEISRLQSQEAVLTARQAYQLGLVHVIEPAPPPPKDRRPQHSGFVLTAGRVLGISRQAADRLVLQGRLPAALHSRFRGGRVAL